MLTEDEVIAALPPWTTQITVRGVGMGVILGAIFSFITMRFSLGPGGVVPTFNMPTGAGHEPAALCTFHFLTDYVAVGSFTQRNVCLSRCLASSHAGRKD